MCVVRVLWEYSIPESHHHHHHIWTMTVYDPSEYIARNRVYTYDVVHIVSFIQREVSNIYIQISEQCLFIGILLLADLPVRCIPYTYTFPQTFCDFLIHISFCCYVYVQRWNRKNGENKNYCWARSWAACGYYCMIFGSLHSARVQPSSLLNFYVVCIYVWIRS